MRFEQIQAFLAVVETGSFQLAAKRCGLTQPTITRQIQALENSLGVELLHRTHKVKPTLAGEIFLTRATKIWREWQAVITELQALQAGTQGELCIAAIHSVCRSFLPLLLPQFYQKFPTTQLRITALGSDRALKVLRDGLVDIAIVMAERHLLKEPHWLIQPLYRESVKIFMANDHPLSQRPQLTWQELASYPHVVFKDGYGMRRLVEREFGQRNLSWQAALELNTPDAFFSFLRHSHMIAILPESAMWEVTDDPNFAIKDFVPSESPPPREVIAITTTDRQTIPPIGYLLSLLQTADYEYSFSRIC
ncbi:MAG: LysR family transcriptional regulator [Pseudanabaenaceae cyanobacterium SKYGB_i_bin29]|nr:LysR family transcriptional regulator [Pseudanabaenaceae cyanobacterium SKYG29]MDW8421857.1 LysR family transcriptional regulator [Pseudanabaenaceae cyanobacterium SKYGB_i_bin29]